MKHSTHATPAGATERLDRCQAELVTLRRRLESAETANQRLAREHALLDERVSVLTRLWVAAAALYEAETEASALRAIEEVMINLAGTEEFGLYEVEGSTLAPVHVFGLSGARVKRHRAAGLVASALLTGQTWRAASPREETGDQPAACIPLRLGKRVAAVIVVWRFLPQKLAFEPFDAELFALLAARAAPALRAARLLEAAG